MADPEVIICRDVANLAERAAEIFVVLAGQAEGATGRVSVALSGGSTPKSFYALLSSSRYRDRIPWTRIHLFWGDERCVPPDHTESNYRMVREVLLSKIAIPAENVHRMAGEKEPDIAAAEYEAELKRFFRLSSGALPRFDLILLGLGEDGHTASLFPGSEALKQTKRLVTACYVTKLKSHRLTLTFSVLNAGAVVIFLVAGKNKAPIVREVLKAKAASLPAGKVKPVDGRLIWFIDLEAAAELT
ncbi:MAG TPA: 6-phosphogluconolactonase [Candidatus Binatia bacterium]|nr:6-phosphogluconolactonase [Candidatus Binatia bacterium]